MFEDSYLDTFMEDQLNGNYGHIMDQCEAEGDFCPRCNTRPCTCPNPDDCPGDDCSEFDGEP